MLLDKYRRKDPEPYTGCIKKLLRKFGWWRYDAHELRDTLANERRMRIRHTEVFARKLKEAQVEIENLQSEIQRLKNIQDDTVMDGIVEIEMIEANEKVV